MNYTQNINRIYNFFCNPKLDMVRMILWIFVIFSYFFQFPFSFLSIFLTPCLLLFIFLELFNLKILNNKKYICLAFIYILFLIFSSIYSLVNGINIIRILRFFIILLMIPLSSNIIDEKFNKYEKIFRYMAIAKSILLIAIAIYLLIKGDHTIIRHWSLTNGYGDIYLLNGIPKVQVQGNALLLIAFFIDFYHKFIKAKNKKFPLTSLIILLGIASAGNFAFVLGIALYSGYYLIIYIHKLICQNKIKIRYLFFVFILLLLIIFPYVQNKIIEKSAHSNKIRFEQAEILLDTNHFIGKGLGNEILAETSEREYNGNIYFELQTLYIYNQIGSIGITLFYLLTLIPLVKLSKEKTILYIIYICYSFWNPYCFDTTQIITTLLIVNMKLIGGFNYYDKSNYYTLQPTKKEY